MSLTQKYNPNLEQIKKQKTKNDLQTNRLFSTETFFTILRKSCDGGNRGLGK